VARLTVTSGPAAGRSIELERDVVIGREDAADLVIADPDVSRRHAVVRPGPGGAVLVEDLGSSNGTFVDGRKISGPVTLNPGAKLQMGDSVFALEPGPAPPAGAPPGPPPGAAAAPPAAAGPPPGAPPGPPPAAGAPAAAAEPAARRRRSPLLIIGLVVLVLAGVAAGAVIALSGGEEETQSKTVNVKVTSPPLLQASTTAISGVMTGKPFGRSAVFIQTRMPLPPQRGGDAVPVNGTVFVTSQDGNMAFNFSGTFALTQNGGEDLQARGRAGNGTGDYEDIEGPVTIAGGRASGSAQESEMTIRGKVTY
jgi:hypothetical protein